MKSLIIVVLIAVLIVGLYGIVAEVIPDMLRFFGLGGKKGEKKQKFIRIGHERKLVSYDDLPEANKYKGRTWLGGLPVYADVVVPDKHFYDTIIYMDHWFKQYVYDVMATWKSVGYVWNGLSWFERMTVKVGALVAILLVLIKSYWLLTLGVLLFVYFFFIAGSSACRATRRMGENAKNFTPATWQKIYLDVAESIEREDEMARAIRKSGVRRWH